jgi:hypothetical protein
MIHPYIFREKSTRLTITGPELDGLITKPKAIMWSRDGIYGLIPIEVVKNHIQLWSDTNKQLEHGDRHASGLNFKWGESLEIPPETGCALESSEKGDE